MRTSGLPPPTEGERESLMGAYDNCITYLDSQTDELLRFLASTPQWSNTIVIITSDLGEAFGDHVTYDHGWNLYRELLHVPLIVLGPGVPAGLRIPHVVRLRELFSTVLDFASLPEPVIHRTSLRRFWTPGFQPSSFDDFVVSELIDYRQPQPTPTSISITTPEWHYIRFTNRHPQLFRWPSDSAERIDLGASAQGQQIANQLSVRLDSIVEESVQPWRGLRYLLALDSPTFSVEAGSRRNVSWKALEGDLPSIPIGAAQSIFPPDPAGTVSSQRRENEELLRSLPYN